MKRVLTTLTLAICLLGAAACSPGGKDDPEPSNGEPTASGSAAPDGDVTPTPDIPSIPPGGKGVAQGLLAYSVSMEPGTQVMANGVFTMPEGESGDVFISVSWVDSETSSVYARGVQTLEGLTSEEVATWQVTAQLPVGAQNVQAVTGAVILDQ
jgi:hypothetical protein